MWSKVALTAFALVGSLDLTAAKCNKATTGLPSSVTTPGGYTGTSTGGPSTITSGTLQPRGVRNLIRNGNFVAYDPSTPGGLYGYEVDGDGEARQVSGLGYTGDGSEESACAYLTVGQPKDSTTNGIDARDVIPDQSVSIKQELQSTDRESVYTMRVWYYVDMNEKANTCKLIATYDNGVLVESDYFPVVAANSGSFSWTALVQESPLISESGYLKFEVRCSDGGSAAVRFDQVFFTNEVSLSDLDDITVIYSAFADASTAPPSLSSTAPIVASTTSSVTLSSAAQSPAASSPGTSATVSDNGTTSGSLTGVASTTTGAGSNGATTTSSSAAASSTSFGDNICATLGSASITGRGCARRPYSGSSGYKQYTSDGTKEQCAALCLKDPRCLSFQWNTKSIGCVNGCYLLETSLADNSANNGGSDSNWAYDRSCIAQTQCPTTVPDNTVCVNVEGSTPGAGCTSNLNGQPRACASPFITTSVSPICGSSACRDVCHQYPSCKSFSYSVTGGQNCKLYSDTASTVATSDGANYLTFFTDRSCNACGSGMAQFKNVATLADPANMPVLTCPAPSSTAAVTSSSLSTSSSSSSSVVSTSAASTTLSASTTTAAPSATTTAATMDACPGGQSCTANLLVPANVYCKRAGQFNLDIGAWLPDSVKFPGKATSPEQCASICSQTKNCNSSSFSPFQGMCFLISETLAQGQFHGATDNNDCDTLYDTLCDTLCDYDCSFKYIARHNFDSHAPYTHNL
ncbi:unnamed protein product [Clonostachys solani]|uniref:Apple domain-containing protein n=1 Tax=Clonostachys solani TaxID=160281 RepID=A0A9N9Z214_9HYPO|nr:unnamed protein product [Clonostachys solani]